MSLVNVSLSAPSTAERGQAFTVTGTVFEGPAPLGIMGLGPIAGAAVGIYRNGTSIGTTTTDGAGFYSKSITINQAGTFGLRAVSLGVWSDIDYITITEPEPEPHWEYHSTYRGIDIEVTMPAGTPYRAYYEGSWHTVSSLNVLKLGIDAYLDQPDPSVINSVTINAPTSHEVKSSLTVSGRVRDQYGEGMGDVSVAIYANEMHVTNTTTNNEGYYSLTMTFSIPGVYELAANAGARWSYTVITITEPEPPPGEPYGVIDDFTVPESLPAGSDVNVRVLLRNAGGASGYLTFGIDGNPSDPDRYIMVEAGATPVLAPGASVWMDVYFRYYKMPSWGFNLTVYNEDGTSQITKTIPLSTPEIVDGHIGDVLYWIEGMAGWENLETYPTPAKIGDDIHLAVYWWNDGSSAVVGNVWAQFTAPDFHVHPPSAVAGQDRLINPGGGAAVQFAPVTLDHIGSWEFSGMLTLDGVQFIDWKKITFAVEEAAVGIPTTLTLSAPNKAGIGEKFNISGLLYETESGIAIPALPIDHSYDGRSLGSSITGVDGEYLKEVSIPDSGTWTLKSDFPGTEGLQSSISLAGTVVATTPIVTAFQIAGSIFTGLALFMYGTR